MLYLICTPAYFVLCHRLSERCVPQKAATRAVGGSRRDGRRQHHAALTCLSSLQRPSAESPLPRRDDKKLQRLYGTSPEEHHPDVRV